MANIIYVTVISSIKLQYYTYKLSYLNLIVIKSVLHFQYYKNSIHFTLNKMGTATSLYQDVVMLYLTVTFSYSDTLWLCFCFSDRCLFICLGAYLSMINKSSYTNQYTQGNYFLLLFPNHSYPFQVQTFQWILCTVYEKSRRYRQCLVSDY